LRTSGWFSKARTLKQNMEPQTSTMKMRMKLFPWRMTLSKLQNTRVMFSITPMVKSNLLHAGNQRTNSPSVEIRGDSPAPQSVHEEAAATHHNAIVAY